MGYERISFDSSRLERLIKELVSSIEGKPCAESLTFRTNLAAVYFEEKEFDECIKICEEAIEIGRENRADFKFIAKAYARIGNAYKKMKDLEKAKMAFEKALTEHRTPDYRSSLSEIESAIKKEVEESYRNPDLAEEEKNKGNELFKKGDFSTAIQHYSEAIPLKDCEKAIELDPTFIKAYLRKANALKGMGKTSQATVAYEKALEIDPTCSEASEGRRNCMMQASADPEERRNRAMNDPEITKILSDPAMRMILEQMQSDPASIQEHLKNPEIAQKFMKLKDSGLISVALSAADALWFSLPFAVESSFLRRKLKSPAKIESQLSTSGEI
ncbi:STIP1 [Lepeophtheirus salmonis]|uniref:Stress-induced-phosphoprotein 1 n=1 Tax=Lepeophtheirus salmonis TaxID=72036 RepID=A0A7R8H503_LEPSM|nr:STIP1 [Lepeophtheirus salmonis]CAF2853652.1 STIP1 [Lepeophtheirus salmonis]